MKRLNYITTFLAEGIVIGSYLLAFKLVAAYAGTEGFGEYSLSRRTLSLLAPLAILGADLGLARYVSYAEAEKSGRSASFATATLIVFVAAIGTVSVVLLVASSFWSQVFFGSPAYTNLILALPPLLAGASLHSIAYSYMRGLNRIQEANVLMAINLGLLPLGAIVFFHGSVLAILDAMGIGWTAVAGLFLIRLPFRFTGVKDRLGDLIRFGVPRTPGEFVVLLLFALPGILVAQAADVRVAGMVAFGVAAVSMIGSGLTPISFLLLPVAARLLAAGKVTQLRSEVVEVVGITLAGTLVLVVLLEVFAGTIVELYLGPSFKSSVDILRLTLIGALPWAAYITLRSVIDARHVKPINARNLAISFAFAVVLALGLKRVADPTTGAVLAFVFALWLLAGLTMLEANKVAEILGNPIDRSPRGLARFALLAALPVVIVVSSPQRPALALVMSFGYVVLALFSLRLSRTNLLMLGYVGAVAAWMTISWLRAKYFLHLDPAQISYGTSKYMYFVFIVLPLAAAVALIVNEVQDAWPIAGSQLAIGAVVGLITVALLGDKILGADRYSWQGDLIALATLIAVQPWLVKNIWASASVGVLGVAGIIFAGARQSLVAFALALLLSAAYWAASKYVRETRGNPMALRNALANRYVVLPLFLLILTGGAIAATYHWTPTSYCYCITDRLISLQSNGPGDRDKMLYRGFELFGQDPLFGTGLGSFAGAVPMSLSPGNFYQYPHNVPLEVASETGLIGFFIIFAPLVAGWLWLLWAGIKRASPAVAGVMMIVTVFFTTANFSGDIPSDRGLWIFGILAFKLGIDAIGLRVTAPSTPAPEARTAPVS
jgi:O-antigen/teichoic acid export membrane protein